MKIVSKKIKELKPAEYNPRLLNAQQFENIKNSLAEFGFVDPVIINSYPGRENVIIGGHQRTKVWESMGNDTVPCLILNIPMKKEKELNVRLNKNTGEWDMEMLSKEFDKHDLLDWGFNLNELPKMEDIQDSIDKKETFDAQKSQSEENYNISYQIVFNNEYEQSTWFKFIKFLKDTQPEKSTISERLIDVANKIMAENE